MPKFIGNKIAGATRIQNNATAPEGYRRISYAQARLLPPSSILCSLDTTDTGSRGSYAKRWYRWFASEAELALHPESTPTMRTRGRGFAARNFQVWEAAL